MTYDKLDWNSRTGCNSKKKKSLKHWEKKHTEVDILRKVWKPINDCISLEDLEDIRFAKATRSKLVRGTSTSLFYRPGLTVGKAIPQEIH